MRYIWAPISLLSLFVGIWAARASMRPIDPVVQLRESVTSVEFRARSLRAQILTPNTEEGICFQLGGLDQAKLDLQRQFYETKMRLEGSESLESSMRDLTSLTEAATHYCYGDLAVVSPANPKRVPQKDRGALTRVLTEIESVSEVMKSAIDRLTISRSSDS